LLLLLLSASLLSYAGGPDLNDRTLAHEVVASSWPQTRLVDLFRVSL